MDNLINKIYNCNNKDILKDIPDKSVQIFLEDMPYGITACKWDTTPDLKEYWELHLSKIKDNGCFVLFGSEPFSSYLRMSNIKMYKYDWIWNKIIASGMQIAKYNPMKQHEIISIFGNKILYKPIMEKMIKPEKYKCYTKSESSPLKKNDGIQRIRDKKYPKTILSFSNANKKGNISPTQKPIALFEYLIKTYSNENDLIFDGFSGSGTTAIACYNINRNFICCEIDKGYYDKSMIRLNEVKKLKKENGGLLF